MVIHNTEQEPIRSDGLNEKMCRGLRKHTPEDFKTPVLLSSLFIQLKYTRRKVRKKTEIVLK